MTTGRFQCLLPLSSVYRRIFYVIYPVMCILLALNILFFIYRVILVVRVKRKMINVWWTIEIVKRDTETWNAKLYMINSWEKISEVRKTECSKTERGETKV